MARNDRPGGLKGAMNIAQRTEGGHKLQAPAGAGARMDHLLVAAGTSKSVLSQTKSFLL